MADQREQSRPGSPMSQENLSNSEFNQYREPFPSDQSSPNNQVPSINRTSSFEPLSIPSLSPSNRSIVSRDTPQLRPHAISNDDESSNPGSSNKRRRIGTDDDGSSDDDRDGGEYYTAVFRKNIDHWNPSKSSRISYFISTHGEGTNNEHHHVVFKSSARNYTRSLRAIASALQLTTSEGQKLHATLQPIRSIKRILYYLLRTGSWRNVGADLKEILNRIMPNITEIKSEPECKITNYLREKRKGTFSNKHSSNNVKWEHIQEMIEKYNAHSTKHLSAIMSLEDSKATFQVVGSTWHPMANKVFDAVNAERYRKITTGTYMDYIKSNQEESKPENVEWLEMLLQENNIPVVNFLTWFIMIIDKKLPKINTFVIKGPPNTGKSMLINLLLQGYPQARISRQGELTPFYLQNLVSKPIGIFEEPRILPTTADDMKLLFGGEPLEVQVKNSDSEKLTRKPIFITSNVSLHDCINRIMYEGIKERCVGFSLTKQIGQGREIDIPKNTITQGDIKCFINKYENEINELLPNLCITQLKPLSTNHI